MKGRVNVLGPVTACVRANTGANSCAKAGFGGQHDALAQRPLCDEHAQHLLAAPAGVNVRCVNKITARVNVGVEHGARAVLARAPTLCAKGHRPKGQRADG